MKLVCLTSVLLLVATQNIINSSCFTDNGDGDVLEFSEARIQTRLRASPLAVFEHNIRDVMHCLIKCLEYFPVCQGVNFLLYNKEMKSGICELLEDSIDQLATQLKLTCAENWVFYGTSQRSV